MSTLDDFFGDGRTKKEPECSYCGGKDGELKVSISDAYGPTHWSHPVCKEKMEAEREQKAEASRQSAFRAAYNDWMEEGGKLEDYLSAGANGDQYSDQAGIDDEE
jgi:hypothetical protein